MDEDIRDEDYFSAFEKREEFVDAENRLLAVDVNVEPSPHEDRVEQDLLNKCTNILYEYQEQAYLLDPYLEDLVVPVIDRLKDHAKTVVSQNGAVGGAPSRVERVSLLLYAFTKFRGYKTILRFFPHEVDDLPIVIAYFGQANSLVHDANQWALRYILLLWTALVCMIPFDLAKFDEVEGGAQTSKDIERIAMKYLSKAGIERDGSAVLLSRLYVRKDTGDLFDKFLHESRSLSNAHAFNAIGVLHALAEFMKSAPSEVAQIYVTRCISIAKDAGSSDVFSSNTLVRKYRTKLLARAALRQLPVKYASKSRLARTLDPAVRTRTEAMDDDFELPEAIEEILQELFDSLQDKDTIVRYSAAKGVARIAERLPDDFQDQILETVLGLFEIHSAAAAAMYDLPSIAEGTWHGASLASAEIARRGLVRSTHLGNLIDWLVKALYFDVRKGAHSIGANVRDAAAYVSWAVARSVSPSELEPHALRIAERLIVVALFDREIQVRRAASAAFQEFVGRTSLFPHGIDLIRIADFYGVGIRRNAFLIAAPEVARFGVYREALFEHLTGITLRHWDPSMRTLGASALKEICLIDVEVLAPLTLSRMNSLLQSVDPTDLHGSLLALSSTAQAYHQCGLGTEERMSKIFAYLGKIPQTFFSSPRNELVTAAACDLISNTITIAEVQQQRSVSVPGWRDIVDRGLKHRSSTVQAAAARAIGAISKLADCHSTVTRLIRELTVGSFHVQQSLGLVLGEIEYDLYPASLSESIHCLLACVKSERWTANIEGRRNCFTAMPKILARVAPHLKERLAPELVEAMYKAMLHGLEDYTRDQRGDVGSWIRIVCLDGLTSFAETLMQTISDTADLQGYLPPALYHQAVGGILKQGVERLDNVRTIAGQCFNRLLSLSVPSEPWSLYSGRLLHETFNSESDPFSWSDAARLFPRAIRFLDVPQYRHPVLKGFVTTIGGLTESTQRPLAMSLISYVEKMPTRDATGSSYDLLTFMDDLIENASLHFTSNSIVVPVLQTFILLLEAGALQALGNDDEGYSRLVSLHGLVTRNADRLKNIQRIHESMKIAVNLLTFTRLYGACVSSLALFLGHRFPTVRSQTAEYLYLALQRMDLDFETDEAEMILLETDWSVEEDALSASERVEIALRSKP